MVLMSFNGSERKSRKRLFREKGFTAVAVEVEWPDAYRVIRYVRCASTNADAVDGGLKRLPFWMWRKADPRWVFTVSTFTVFTHPFRGSTDLSRQN